MTEKEKLFRMANAEGHLIAFAKAIEEVQRLTALLEEAQEKVKTTYEGVVACAVSLAAVEWKDHT